MAPSAGPSPRGGVYGPSAPQNATSQTPQNLTEVTEHAAVGTETAGAPATLDPLLSEKRTKLPSN
jgi:hypothetical protein